MLPRWDLSLRTHTHTCVRVRPCSGTVYASTTAALLVFAAQRLRTQHNRTVLNNLGVLRFGRQHGTAVVVGTTTGAIARPRRRFRHRRRCRGSGRPRSVVRRVEFLPSLGFAEAVKGRGKQRGGDRRGDADADR